MQIVNTPIQPSIELYKFLQQFENGERIEKILIHFEKIYREFNEGTFYVKWSIEEQGKYRLEFEDGRKFVLFIIRKYDDEMKNYYIWKDWFIRKYKLTENISQATQKG